MILDLFLSLPITFKQTLRVQCSVFSKDKSFAKKCTLLIDTGASSTSLTRKFVLMRLKYADIIKSKMPQLTATGLVQFDTTIISKIDIAGEFEVSNLQVNILEWENSALDGVIGMDILSKLHFHSDTKYFRLQNKPFVL